MPDPKKLLIAADMDRTFLDRAGADRRFQIEQRRVRSEHELAAIVGDCEILVSRAFHPITRRVIEAAPRLRLIAQGTSGVDNIDHAAARERDIALISLPGGNANAVAELVIGYVISLTRTVPLYTRQVLAGVWQRDDCATRHELRHFTLGIIGLGQVGRRVSRLAGLLGMRARAVDPYLTEADFDERGAKPAATLDELLTTSDIVTIHVPLTSETRKFIAERQIARLRPGSFLINASRGEVLDQNAALDALRSNHLAGLALDVYDPEPPMIAFPDDQRLILTPHIAGCSFECKAAIGEELYEKICRHYWG